METEDPVGKPPTILDVARRAGVSKSTVSNVIRGIRSITPETQLKVTKAIEELGYRPNILARQMVHQRTTIFGVVVGDLANPFYAEMAKQIERSAAARGYRVMFCNTQGEETAEMAGLEGLLEQRVAGIIFLAYAGGSTAAAGPCSRVGCLSSSSPARPIGAMSSAPTTSAAAGSPPST